MSTTPTFTTEAIGRTEKAMNAILDRLLRDTGLTEPGWVTLTLTVRSGGSAEAAELAARVAAALKVGDADARARIAELAASGLVETGGDGSHVTLTDAGRELHARIGAAAARVTERLWGDLPDGDLQAAGRVLYTVLARANSELATGPQA